MSVTIPVAIAIITLTACTIWAAIIIRLCVWAHDREVRMDNERKERRVRFVQCPECGTITPKGRNEPGERVSMTACRLCYMAFDSTHLPSWLEHPDPLTGGVRDDD